MRRRHTRSRAASRPALWPRVRLALRAAALAAPMAAVPAIAAALPARQPDTAAIDELLRSARLWQSLGHPEIERLVLRKLLAVQADEPHALFLLGELELRAGQMDAARRVLALLRRAQPQGAALRELQAMERVYAGDARRLSELRLAVRGGQRARALALARALFPDGRPPGDLANEFAPVLAATPAGWDALRGYLRERIAADPSSADRLTLYELLAQHPDTRPEALRGFAELARAHDVEPQRIAGAWRRALSDLADDDAGLAERRRFLDRYPRDVEVRNEVARTEAARLAREQLADDPGVLARQAGERALDAGALDEAEAQLQRSLLLRPGDGETLGTLGLLRLRQGRDDEALQRFNQAIAAEPASDGRRARWVDLAVTARYWSALQRAKALRDAGDLEGAARLVESVQATQPDQDEAAHLLASLRAAQGRFADAESLYRQLLRRDPADRRAWQGLLSLWLQQGRIEFALDEARDLPLKAGIPVADALDAGALRDAIASAARAAGAPQRAGHPDAALRLLERAVALLPREPWLRYDLAQEYQRLQLPALARRVMHEGLVQAPDDPAMRYAAALVDAATDHEDAALAGVEAIPAAARTDGMRSLAQRLRFERDLSAARAARAAGDAQQDAHWRAQALAEAAADPGRLLRVARADLSADDVTVARSLLAPLSEPDAPLTDAQRRELAGALIDAGEPEAARRQIDAMTVTASAQRLAAPPSAPAQDDAGAAGAAGAAGTTAASGATPAAPADAMPELLLLSARAHLAEHDAAAARADWMSLRELLPPAEVPLHLEAIGQMDADPDLAHAWMAELLARHPRDPEVLLEAARQARRGHQYETALQFLHEVGAPPAASPALAAPLLPGLAPPAPAPVPGSVALLSPPIPLLARSAPATAPEGAPDARSAQRDFLLGLLGESDMAGGGAAAAPDLQDPRYRAQQAAAEIEARRQPHVDTAWLAYWRSADAGISTLHGTEIPVIVTWPGGYDGHWFAQVDSVHLNAGTLPAALGAAEDFGKVLALAPNGLAAPVAESAEGLSAAAGWRGDDRRFDLGVVGIGFKVPNIVGGWRESATWNDTDVSAEVSRRVLTGSLLSYAGAADPVTGTAWGGVTSTGLTLRAGRDFAHGWSGSTSLTLGLLTGRNVQSNSDVQSRTVIDRDWVHRPDFRLSAGGLLSVWHYQSNDSFYTFGQGGYYSPQRYVSLGVPVEVEGRHGGFSYDVRAVPSHSWTYEQNVPFYPTDGGLQRLAGDPVHSAGSGGGLAGSLRADLEYRAAAHWTIGAWFNIDRSAYYAPTQAMIYLRYWFEPQQGPVLFPPHPVLPVSQF